jgi:hypothetical protein
MYFQYGKVYWKYVKCIENMKIIYWEYVIMYEKYGKSIKLHNMYKKYGNNVIKILNEVLKILK